MKPQLNDDQAMIYFVRLSKNEEQLVVGGGLTATAIFEDLCLKPVQASVFSCSFP